MKGKLQLANGQFEKRKSPPGQKWRDRKGERERVKGSVCVCVLGFLFWGGGLILEYDLLVNLGCLWKAAQSMMRKPVTPPNNR